MSMFGAEIDGGRTEKLGRLSCAYHWQTESTAFRRLRIDMSEKHKTGLLAFWR